MLCPQCEAELTELSSDDERAFACPSCTGLWVDGSQLNALLLRRSLPGLDSLGGRADPGAASGTCRECGVDLARIEQAGRHDALSYETCEDCGFVSVPGDEEVAADLEAARSTLVAFFREFSGKRSTAKR